MARKSFLASIVLVIGALAFPLSGKGVPAGTGLTVRMIDGIDSKQSQIGQTFRASLEEPVMSGSETVIPQGSDVTLRLIRSKQAGRLFGRTELTLDVVSVNVNGRTIDVDTSEATTTGRSRSHKSAALMGGGAALGALLGGVAGGGTGAAIGALSGAGAGGTVQILTKGDRVKIPPETCLTFTLQHALQL
jgi:hypothetical protein